MTRHKDLKRIIRDRMEKTGESYTTARLRIVSKQPPPNLPAARSVDLAALAGMSDDKIAAKTGRTWRDWVRVLDADNAASMPHRDIALLVGSKHGAAMWWAQTVTVGYERIKGLRERGQRRSGEYEVGKSKTFGVSVNTLFDAWANAATRRRWLDGVKLVVRTANRPKSMRLQWPDGTLVVVGFIAKGSAAKGGAKSVVSLAHTKLPTRAASDAAKKFWTNQLAALSSLLGERKSSGRATRLK